MKSKSRRSLSNELLPALVLLGLLLAAGAARAQFTCVTNNGSITVTGYTGTNEDVAIPGIINGLPVTSIGDGAFMGADWNFLSVAIPPGVTNIGQNAFSYCHDLKSVAIYSFSYVSIGDQAFFSDDSLTNVAGLGEVVSSIGNEAFDNCGLTSVTISPSVTHIGTSPFRACYELTNITVHAGNSCYTNDAAGVLFDKTMTTLIQYPCGMTGGYNIPASVSNIAPAAFADGTLNSVFLGGYAGTISIGTNAFSDCQLLTNVVIYPSVTNLGSCAFAGCPALTTVFFPGYPPFLAMPALVPNADNTTFAGDNKVTVYAPPGVLPGTGGWGATFAGLPTAFEYATNGVSFTYQITNGPATIIHCSLGNVYALNIPSAIGGLPVTVLKGQGSAGLFDSPFNGLVSVTIPKSVTDIEWAFVYCWNLGPVTIPNSVTNLGYGAFYHSGCGNLMIPSSVISVGDYAFWNSYDCLYNVAISDGVKNIGNFAFSGCNRLGNVTLPASVTSIGIAAFADSEGGLTNIAVDAGNPDYASVAGVLFDKSLTTLLQFPGGQRGSYAIPDGVTTIADHAFEGSLYLTNVSIPDGVTSIGNFAFNNCGLIGVTIPASVTNIGDRAFWQCPLASISVVAQNPSYASDSGVLFNKTLTSLLQAPAGQFGSCVIPASVNRIGDFAFDACFAITNAYCLGNAPSANGSIFTNNGTVYYLPGTAGWGTNFGGWPTAPWYLPNPVILANSASLDAQYNRFGFTISWATNAAAVVETCTNLAPPAWQPVQTNALVNGTNYFSDASGINAATRFYRVRAQ